MTTHLDIVPVKSSDIEVMPYDGSGHLLVHKKLNYHLNVNQLVVDLLNLIDGKQTIKELSRAFYTQHNKEISGEKIHEILYDNLGQYHIIENDKFEYVPLGKPDYLKLSFTLLKKEWIQPITKMMSPLFSKNVFYSSLLLSLLLILVIGVSHYKVIYNAIILGEQSINLTFMVVASVITVMMHEFGHAAACRYYGADHGEIGFGFYLLTPVMYADVSNIWKLKRKERIIVNLAGLYVQLVIAGILGVLYIISSQIEFLSLMYFLGILSLAFNLNPFFRTDGYWVLSDLTGINNLRASSQQKIKDAVNWILGIGTFTFSKKNTLLLIYGTISTAVIFIFLGWVVTSDFQSLLSFPTDLFSFLKDSITDTNKITFERFQQLAVFLLFYVLSIRFIRKNYNKRIKTLPLAKKKELLALIISTFLSGVYLLSAIGKTIGLAGFTNNIEQYPFYFKGLPHLIVGMEYALALGFILVVAKRLISKLSLLFLAAITAVYMYGYLVYGIQKCDCFGSITILNSDNVVVTIVKNIILGLLSLYLVKFSVKSTWKYLYKTVLPAGVVLVLSIAIFQYSTTASVGFAQTHKGKAIVNLGVPIHPEMQHSTYWFLFSPNCEHCRDAIPSINALMSNEGNVVGISLSGKDEDLAKLDTEMGMNFPIVTISRDEFLKLTKKVPVLFHMKQDTIFNVLNGAMLKNK